RCAGARGGRLVRDLREIRQTGTVWFMLPANLLNSDRAGAPMLNIKKILLPLDLEETVLPVVVIRQAAALAHHFHSEILVLHVIRTLSYWTSSDSARELIEKGVANEQERLKDCL